MEKVTGIGGLFFRSRDPDRLARWYQDNLGILSVGGGYDDPVWTQEEGETVFAPFSQDSEHFERPEQQWAVNFRVRDLEAMVVQLRTAGAEVEIDPELYPNGRFAGTRDPEGNPIQLWEPK
ncbi:MAG: VOC family protein [Actinomycetota bacterium]|nr:VOC family protein [Actinomycetota bacterium]